MTIIHMVKTSGRTPLLQQMIVFIQNVIYKACNFCLLQVVFSDDYRVSYPLIHCSNLNWQNSLVRRRNCQIKAKLSEGSEEPHCCDFCGKNGPKKYKLAEGDFMRLTEFYIDSSMNYEVIRRRRR